MVHDRAIKVRPAVQGDGIRSVRGMFRAIDMNLYELAHEGHMLVGRELWGGRKYCNPNVTPKPVGYYTAAVMVVTTTSRVSTVKDPLIGDCDIRCDKIGQEQSGEDSQADVQGSLPLKTRGNQRLTYITSPYRGQRLDEAELAAEATLDGRFDLLQRPSVYRMLVRS
jgi:hypothetical protein